VRSLSRSIISSIPKRWYGRPTWLMSSCGCCTSGRCRASYRFIAAASFGVIGTRRDFLPLAPASQRTRSSTRPRWIESSMRSGSPSVPTTASPHSSDSRRPVPTRMRTASASCGSRALHAARIWRTCAMWYTVASWIGTIGPLQLQDAVIDRVSLGVRPAEERHQHPVRVEDRSCRERLAVPAPGGRELRPVRPDHLHVHVVEPAHVRVLGTQPAQERQDHVVVVVQRVRRHEIALPFQPKVLVGGLHARTNASLRRAL